jgi:uncharacterized protein with von Willebrand factor type A (vWA) domain
VEQKPKAVSPVTAQVVHFAGRLRAAGLPISPAQTLDFVHCLPLIDIADRRAVRDAARAIFVRRREDLAAFEDAFDRFWTGALLDPRSKRGMVEAQRRAAVWEAHALQAADLAEAHDVQLDRARTWSADERLLRHDFGELSADQAAALQAALQQLARRLPTRRSRRLEGSRRGRRIDLRTTLRASLHTAGEPLHLARRRRRIRPRPLLLLCDVSGSMERYARVLLQFAYALAGAQPHVEAFVFATQLTRVSKLLRSGTGKAAAQAALAASAAAAKDFGGGTRIGACLRTLRTRWPQALGRGTVVLLVSDGCDRGDLELLAHELAIVQRRCHQLIWLNPWLDQEGYQPQVRGMQAALPHIDQLLPIHNLASLEQLVAIIAGLST